jgi:hypothetical protein
MSQPQGTLTVRVRGVPFPIQFADWTHDRLWHTVELEGNDSQEIIMFIGGIGSPIPGGARTLTVVDTNIPRSGDTGVPEGWEELIYSIQLEITREMGRTATPGAFALQDTWEAQLSRPAHVGGEDPASSAAGGVLFDFIRKVYCRFTVNQKVQSEGPASKYPQGSGISLFSTETSQEVANNGVPSPRDQVAFVLPIWLRPNIAYAMKLAPSAALGVSGIAPQGWLTNGYFDWTELPATNLGFDVRCTLEGLLKRPVT